MNDSERTLKAKADEEKQNMWQHIEKHSLKVEPTSSSEAKNERKY